MNDVRLRDKRKPGHCWQDNELYDAFGPVIGADAVLVYVQMTRHCYGTEIRCSSRELAAECGKSKNTVLRSLRVMERVGMLRAVGGGQRKAAEYHLADLKELAMHHGASYDSRRVSYVFSAEQAAALRVAAAGPVGDRLLDASGPGGDSEEPDLALQRARSGSVQAQPTSYYSKQQDKQNTPPPTPSTEGDAIALAISFRGELSSGGDGSPPKFATRAEQVRWQEAKLKALRDGRAVVRDGRVTHVEPPCTPSPPGRMRRRRGPSDGCSAIGAMR